MVRKSDVYTYATCTRDLRQIKVSVAAAAPGRCTAAVAVSPTVESERHSTDIVRQSDSHTVGQSDRYPTGVQQQPDSV